MLHAVPQQGYGLCGIRSGVQQLRFDDDDWPGLL